jgi:hypothetical protein
MSNALHCAPRRGALLIIVTGIAALLLSLAVAFLTVMRADSRQTMAVLQDAQARATLLAGMSYILESSRIGWGDQETLGWNDIRSHATGPIPITGDPWAGLPTEPDDRVWSAGNWPAPGTVMRAPLYVWTRAPYAVRGGPRNPVRVWPDAASLPSGGGIYDDPGNSDAVVLSNHEGQNGSYAMVGDVWRLGSLRAPDPQAVVDPQVDRTAWQQGDSTPMSGTQHLAWFRIYRETPEDHDGDGIPYFDVLNCNGGTSPVTDGAIRPNPPNASIFIITCGAGASLGFRDWADVQAAGEESAFGNDPDQFTFVRATETILWYRIEWSPFVGDNAGKGSRQGNSDGLSGMPLNSDRAVGSSTAVYSTPSFFGSIRWMQRLDREPPVW